METNQNTILEFKKPRGNFLDPDEYDNDNVRAAVEEIGNDVRFQDEEDEERYKNKHCDKNL